MLRPANAAFSRRNWSLGTLQAVKAGGTDVVGISWKQCPIRAASAASVLTAHDFLVQVEQALEYTRATAEHFRRVGYLRDTR